MRPEALLAIRSDIAAAVEQDYLEWLTREHTLERLGIGGFLSARIFRAKHPGFGRYLILYELADAGVVDSPAYLERLNNPTPWTTRMMPHLGNFVRGGGRFTSGFGTGYGGALVPVMMKNCTWADDNPLFEAISKLAGVVAVRVLKTDSDRTAVRTNERALRAGDQSFESLLMIEALDHDAAMLAAQRMPHEVLQSRQSFGVDDSSAYSLIFQITR